LLALGEGDTDAEPSLLLEPNTACRQVAEWLLCECGDDDVQAAIRRELAKDGKRL
jgi:hypothetical protein